MMNSIWDIAKILSGFLIVTGVYIIAKNHGYNNVSTRELKLAA